MNWRPSMRLLVLVTTIWIQFTLSGSVSLCTDPGNIPSLYLGTRLKESVFAVLHPVGLILCAKECLLRSVCCSFNFSPDLGECELNWACSEDPSTQVFLLTNATGYLFSLGIDWNKSLTMSCEDHNCSSNTRCNGGDAGSYTCTITHCFAPSVVNGALSSQSLQPVHSVGATLPYVCNHGYTPCGNLVCHNDGLWSSAECKSIQSCEDVQRLSNLYLDGEYWLAPLPFPNTLVRVYCHDMTSSGPREFITLPTPYYMDAPKTINYHCTGESSTTNNLGYLGRLAYEKFGLNIQLMRVRGSDRTYFTNESSDNFHDVGFVTDCYTMYPNPCGPVGNARVDMRGTGLKFKETVTWLKDEAATTYPPEVVRSHNGQVIDIRCGGYCGTCWISGDIDLDLVPDDAPVDNTAEHPTCEL